MKNPLPILAILALAPWARASPVAVTQDGTSGVVIVAPGNPSGMMAPSNYIIELQAGAELQVDDNAELVVSPYAYLTGLLSSDGGTIYTDGAGDLTAVYVTTENGLFVSGVTALDSGSITTDGGGNITVEGLNAVGNLNITGSLSLDSGQIVTDGGGTITVGGLNDVGSLNIVGISSLDNGQIVTDGGGGMELYGAISFDGGTISSNGWGTLYVQGLRIQNTLTDAYGASGSSGQVLQNFSGEPSWGTPSSVHTLSGTLVSGSKTETVPSGALPWVQDTDASPIAETLSVTVSGTTATVHSSTGTSTSTFTLFYWQ
jgi:hypothetical protein